METREWRDVIDKSTWSRGPWDDEPDKAQWSDPATGLPCLIVRNGLGSLCGYVGVLEGHPLFGVDFSGSMDGGVYVNGPDATIDVHGGLTFSDFCAPDPEGNEGVGICHVPGPGEPDRVFWFGFDCAHYSDIRPGQRALLHRGLKPEAIDRLLKPWDEVYRDVDYVREEIAKLAAQLAAWPGSRFRDNGEPVRHARTEAER